MKKTLHDLLAPTPDQVQRLTTALQEEPATTRSEEEFQAFYASVQTQMSGGESAPASLRALVEGICVRCKVTSAEVASRIQAPSDQWHQAVENIIEPHRIAVDYFVRLARAFEIGFDALRDAILGSHQLFLKRGLDSHVRFAKSERNARRKDGYGEKLEAAFEELRTKNARYRASLESDEKINQYLKELQKSLLS